MFREHTRGPRGIHAHGRRPFRRHARYLQAYRGTSLIRNSAPLGTYSRAMPRALQWRLMPRPESTPSSLASFTPTGGDLFADMQGTTRLGGEGPRPGPSTTPKSNILRVGYWVLGGDCASREHTRGLHAHWRRLFADMQGPLSSEYGTCKIVKARYARYCSTYLLKYVTSSA